jgi:hypothetical protein
MTEPLAELSPPTACELDARELATVLAALRYWQEEMVPHAGPCNLTHFADMLPLDADEIDALCERLNRTEAVHGP